MCQYPYKTDYKSVTNFLFDLSHGCNGFVIKTMYLCSGFKTETI